MIVVWHHVRREFGGVPVSAANTVLMDAGALIVTLLLLVAPGAIVLRAMNWRGWAYSAAPLVTFACVSVGMTLDSVIGIGWNLFTLIVSTVLLAGACWGVRRWQLPALGLPDVDSVRQASTPKATGWSATRTADIAVWAAMLVGGCFGTAIVLTAINDLTRIQQDWDATFHGMALQLIHELGTTNLYDLGEVLRPHDPASYYYPAAWHALTEFGLYLPGIGVPRLLNVAIALIPFVLVLGIGGLVRMWSGSAPLAITTCLILPWASAPYDNLWRGPLVPYAYGLALLAPMCVLMLKQYVDRNVAGAAVIGISAAALVSVHPTMAIMAVLFMLALTTHRWVMLRGRSAASDTVSLLLAAIVSLPFCLPGLLAARRVTSTAGAMNWPAHLTPREATYQLFTDSYWYREPSFVLGLLGLVSLVIGWPLLKRWIGWGLIATAFGVMFIVSTTVDGHNVEQITSPWWNDSYRMIAIAWMMAPVVVACGIVMAARYGGRFLATAAARSERAQNWSAEKLRWGAQAVVAALLLGTVFVATDVGRYRANADSMSHIWEYGVFVDDDERAAYDALAEQLGPDARVLNDPNDGSPWMYTLDGVNVVFRYRLSGQQRPFMSENELAVLDSLNQIETNEAVQKAVQEMGITHVVLGTPVEMPPGRPPGFENMPEDSAWLTPLPNVGPMRVWEVTPPTN